MSENTLYEAMIAAVRYAAARPYFADQPDAKMRIALKPIVKPEWLNEPKPTEPKAEPEPEHRGPGRPRKNW
ncbi:MAG: hypothetical protein WC551_10575 [Patescibacteria group bacterium]